MGQSSLVRKLNVTMTARLAVTLLSLVPLVARAQAPVIQISGANFRPLPLAYPAPANGPQVTRSTAAEFDSAMSFDLTAAGLFQVLDRQSFTAAPNEGFTAASIQFNRWEDAGAELLVKVQLSMQGDQLHGEMRLFNVGGAKETARADKSVPPKDARRLAHALADALYKQLTHEPPPFGTRLAFAKKLGVNKEIVVSDWDGRNNWMAISGGMNLLPALVPDGVAVAFTSYRRGRPEIFLQRVGSQATPLVSLGQMTTGVAYSPDGKRMAFSNADGEGAQVWVAEADGSRAHAITSTPYFINSSPSWSPDGKRIAFVSNRGGSPQVYTMAADGSEVRRVTFQGNYNQTPAWSPRGDLIAFTARDERNAFDIFTVNVENGKVTRLTQDQGNNEEPTFSPNGRLVIFSSTRKGPSALYVMTSEGNNQLPLPMERGDYTTPDWGR